MTDVREIIAHLITPEAWRGNDVSDLDRRNYLRDQAFRKADAILSALAENGKMIVDPQIWLQAVEQTEYHRSQVIGLYGPTPEGSTSKLNKHMVRDYTQPPEDRHVWSAFGDEDDYERLHATMMRQVELYKTKIIAERYEAIITNNEED